jgi:hypothetical protein
VLLVLSGAVQNSMNGGDNSLVSELVSAVTLVGLNYNRHTPRSEQIARSADRRTSDGDHSAGRVFEDVSDGRSWPP